VLLQLKVSWIALAASCFVLLMISLVIFWQARNAVMPKKLVFLVSNGFRGPVKILEDGKGRSPEYFEGVILIRINPKGVGLVKTISELPTFYQASVQEVSDPINDSYKANDQQPNLVVVGGGSGIRLEKGKKVRWRDFEVINAPERVGAKP
jgi:hypothetical protein